MKHKPKNYLCRCSIFWTEKGSSTDYFVHPADMTISSLSANLSFLPRFSYRKQTLVVLLNEQAKTVKKIVGNIRSLLCSDEAYDKATVCVGECGRAHNA